jgi:hypothetical protein
VFPTLADDLRAWVRPKLSSTATKLVVAGLVLLEAGRRLGNRASRL